MVNILSWLFSDCKPPYNYNISRYACRPFWLHFSAIMNKRLTKQHNHIFFRRHHHTNVWRCSRLLRILPTRCNILEHTYENQSERNLVKELVEKKTFWLRAAFPSFYPYKLENPLYKGKDDLDRLILIK